MDDNLQNKFGNQTITRECHTSFPSWVQNLPTLPFFYLQIQMVFIFCITQFLHHLILKRIGMPPLVSQMLAGIAIGPAGFGRYQEFNDILFSRNSFEVTNCMAKLSFTLNEFLVASQMDFAIIKRTSKGPIMIGVLSFILGLIANSLTVLQLLPEYHGMHIEDLKVAIFFMPSTSFPSLVSLLHDMKLANSELGRLTLATALCMEVLSITLYILTTTIILPGFSKRKLLEGMINMLGTTALVLFLIFILRPIFLLLISVTPKEKPMKEAYVLLALLAALGCGLYTNHFGQLVNRGIFLVGCALPKGPPMGSTLVDKFGSLFFGILFPFFVSLTTSKIDFSSINFQEDLVYHIGLVVIVTMVIKVISCFTCGIYSNMAHQDALSFAFLICFKGFMELGLISVLTELEKMSKECFSVLAMYIILVSVTVPTIVNLMYNPMRKYGGYQIRDIMHLKSNATLKMVTCVLRSWNISSISNLISIVNPTTEAPIVIHILHLMKLEGRCHSLFISHDIQKNSSYRFYSEELLCNFNRIQNFSKGELSTHVYTAVTQTDAMHEYICTLALDEVVSLIVLPFHRKFGIDGTVAYDDHEQRILNRSVLSRSPCSIVVLVDRSHVKLRRHDTSPIEVVTTTTKVLLSVAVIFIGGNDDREALAFGHHMKRGMKIELIVIRLATPNDGEEFLNSLDLKAIDLLLKKISTEDTQQIIYKQVTVKDGIETALKLRSLVQDYDLMIVGRRFSLECPQTSGMSESSEIKELGVLGDLLASPNLKCRASILVVQQQKHWN